eukprot:m.21473 g.21473  ORF g.21473 m.21473 type:complete len:407 (+) comp7155_c0_seq1:2074-3294(+)
MLGFLTSEAPRSPKLRRKLKRKNDSISGHIINEILRLVQLSLVLCLCGGLVSYELADSEVLKFRPEHIKLSINDLPPGQGLKLKRRVGRKGTPCNDQNGFFKQFDGIYCGESIFEGSLDSDNTQGEFSMEWGPPVERQLRKVEFSHKTFSSVSNAKEYHTRFWGLASAEQLVPHYLMSDITETVPTLGEDGHLLLWDPSRMAWSLPSTAPEEAFGKVLVYSFRVGRTVARLTISGHARNFASELTPGFVMRIAAKVRASVRANSPSPRMVAMRNAALSVSKFVRRFDKNFVRMGNKLTTSFLQFYEESLDKLKQSTSHHTTFTVPAQTVNSIEEDYANNNDSSNFLDADGIDFEDYSEETSADTMIYGLLRCACMIFIVLAIIGTCETLESSRHKGHTSFLSTPVM